MRHRLPKAPKPSVILPQGVEVIVLEGSSDCWSIKQIAEVRRLLGDIVPQRVNGEVARDKLRIVISLNLSRQSKFLYEGTYELSYAHWPKGSEPQDAEMRARTLQYAVGSALMEAMSAARRSLPRRAANKTSVPQKQARTLRLFNAQAENRDPSS